MSRISTLTYKEGEFTFHEINLITDQDSTKLKRFNKDSIISLLKPILDTKNENNIIFSKGELEGPTLEFEKVKIRD